MLQKLESKELKDVWSESCFIPLVRCPWGCSDYYHQTNDLPYDYFVRYILDCDVKVYSPGTLGSWTRGVRRDFLESHQATISQNPEWRCLPLVIMVAGKGPRLLCCRNHDMCIMLLITFMC